MFLEGDDRVKYGMIIVCVFASALAAQPDTLWTRTYDIQALDYCESILATEDGGFVLAGCTRDPSYNDVCVLKVDSNGDIEWNLIYGTDQQDDAALSIIETYDGGYAIAGQTTAEYKSGFDFLLMKLDGDGNVEWSGNYGGSLQDHAADLIQTSDGGYLSVGYGYDVVKDIMVLKTDSNGAEEWRRYYGSPMWSESARSVMEVSQGYLLGGWSSEDDSSSCYYAKLIDWAGDPVDEYFYNYSENEFAWDMCGSDQGGFVLAGESYSFGNGGQALIICSDASGDQQWMTVAGGPADDEIFGITRTLYDGYLAVGRSETSTDNDDFWAVKLDTDGNILWEETWDFNDYDIANCVTQTQDGGYAIAGETYVGSYMMDIVLIRLEPPAGMEEQGAVPLFSLASNPSGASQVFSVIMDEPGSVNLKVYDVTGREVATVFSGTLHSGTHSLSIDDLPSGVYTSRLIVGQGSSALRFTVIR
jgi:hypothetical protein